MVPLRVGNFVCQSGLEKHFLLLYLQIKLSIYKAIKISIIKINQIWTYNGQGHSVSGHLNFSAVIFSGAQNFLEKV
jgi:hypothetical protein